MPDSADRAVELEEKVIVLLRETFGTIVNQVEVGIASAALLTVVARVYARTQAPIELAMAMLKTMHEHHLKEPPEMMAGYFVPEIKA